ncbi:hypothetical protein ACFFTN_12785 [Aminobacter aganoensis]|uniref:Uncharacterized protein n=1 Tax=Aminobacter aganoensis TaxID=83264 RepID=A0A7X0KM65_9HYPH|nr:hypothetical protein [Aminobacter aganoensis]MBB6355815.1 hypothetical protein [Aminobacter aganoensis]
MTRNVNDPDGEADAGRADRHNNSYDRRDRQARRHVGSAGKRVELNYGVIGNKSRAWYSDFEE